VYCSGGIKERVVKERRKGETMGLNCLDSERAYYMKGFVSKGDLSEEQPHPWPSKSQMRSIAKSA
jgi:hypothetical protein